MIPWFIATKQFRPSDGESWSSYVKWSGLSQLREVVSLDGILCPSILPDIRDDYWPHIVNEDFMTSFFLDFEFLMREVAGVGNKNVLCVFRNPQQQPIVPSVANFEFPGYDLVEAQSGVSALTNCGGFPDVFANSELSEVGLLPELQRALEVQALLRSLHPGDPHANCDVWAIFRVVEFVASPGLLARS